MRRALDTMLRTMLVTATLLLAATALLPAAQGADLCPAKPTGLCVEREGACVSAVWMATYDYGAGAANCPEASVGPHGTGACESFWAGWGGWSGFFGVAGSVCAGLDSEGNGCVLASLQVNEDVSTLKPLCLA